METKEIVWDDGTHKAVVKGVPVDSKGYKYTEVSAIMLELTDKLNNIGVTDLEIIIKEVNK